MKIALLAIHFNPRSPHGERPIFAIRHSARKLFQSTLPARGATTQLDTAFQSADISIHAPRTGSDNGVLSDVTNVVDFNPRSPHGERPEVGAKYNNYELISIHAPRTGSDSLCALAVIVGLVISIHAPRTGSDAGLPHLVSCPADFNPRSPHGERLHNVLQSTRLVNISIHAPRTGSDSSLLPVSLRRWYFNPRSPHGERRLLPSGWRNSPYNISIHAPRTGSDKVFHTLTALNADFNPRSPHGERPVRHLRRGEVCHFNPRSPHGERPFVFERQGFLI